MEQNSTLDLQVILDALPGCFMVVEPNTPRYTILAISDDLLTSTARQRDEVVGKNVFVVFPENPDAITATGPNNLRISFQNAIRHKRADQMPVVRYDMPTPQGGFEERYWSATTKPVLNTAGQVTYLICTITDVTHQVLEENTQGTLTRMEKAYNLFMQAPVAVCIVTGPENIIELANEELLRFWGKTEEVVGQPLLEAMPETRHQGMAKILDHVRKTGESFSAKDYATPIFRNGREEIHYFTLVCQPYFGNPLDQVPSGVFTMAHDVTEQVLNRRQVEASEHRFRSLIEESPVATSLVTGKDLIVEVVNDTMLGLWGKTTEVLGMPLRKALPELEGQPFFDLLDRVFASGETYEAHSAEAYLLVEGKPKLFYFDFTYKPLLNPEREVYGILSIALDVTEQVTARQHLEESTDELRNLANAMPQIVWIAGVDGKVTYYNDRVAEFAGAFQLPDGTWRWEGMLHPEDVGPTIEAWAKSVSEGTIYQIEHRLQMKNGTYRWHLSRSLPQGDEQGQIMKWYGTATDVHEQKENAEALKNFKFMAEQASDAFILMRQDGTFAYLNQTALQAWGYTREEVLHLRVPDIDPVHQDELFAQIFSKAQRQIIPPFRTLHKRKDGQIFPAEVNLVGLLLEGEPHLFAIARDITESKLAEEILEAKNAELNRINNDLDNFIYTASHDLKAPISNIEGLLELLSFDPEATDLHQQQLIVDLMQESVERFKKTIGSLTDVVKLQQESLAEPVLVSLPEVIKEVSLDMASLLKEAQVDVEVDVSECTVVRFSEKNLRSLVYNLLSNSVKYRSLDRAAHIKVSCHCTPAHHVLSVADNGLGIEPERFDELFHMFKRFHDHVEGTGIGLYMVKKMVENAGGHIAVESQVGVGTTFRIYFKHDQAC